MKKTFLVKRNALLSPTNFSWGVFALIFAVLFLILRIVAPNFFWQMLSPVFHASDAFAEKRTAFFSGFKSTVELATQNKKLIGENNRLSNENQALVKKIESISKLSENSTGITVGIIARPPSSPYDTLVLSGGSNDGIKLGMEAFGLPAQAGNGGVPIGIVSSVLLDFSRVTLFSAPGTITNGWVGNDNLALYINGAGAGVMNASVPRSAGIKVGDIVFAPGPGMLPIGSVVRVESESSSPSVTLRIMPAVNLFSIGWVTLRDIGKSLP